MISEFQNQLTRREIFLGVLIYINRRLRIIILPFLLAVTAFEYQNSGDIFFSGLVAVLSALFAEVVMVLLLAKNFSPQKIASYKFFEENLEITGSNGAKQNYPYRQIESVVTKSVIVLMLSKNSFAIVAKQHLDAEQIRILCR